MYIMTEKNLPTSVQQHISGLEQRIAELEAENEKLKDALKVIWAGTHVGMPAWEFVEATLRDVEAATDGTSTK